MISKTLVSYDALGAFEITEGELLDVVSAGLTAAVGLKATANNTCGTDINQDCVDNVNNTCVYTNPGCGTDTFCIGVAV